jgi:hypothetical protein
MMSSMPGIVAFATHAGLSLVESRQHSHRSVFVD